MKVFHKCSNTREAVCAICYKRGLGCVSGVLRELGVLQGEIDSLEAWGYFISPAFKDDPSVSVPNGDGLVIKGDSTPCIADGTQPKESVLEVAHNMPCPREIGGQVGDLMIGRGGGDMLLARGRAYCDGRAIMIYVGEGGTRGIIKTRGSRVRDGGF